MLQGQAPRDQETNENMEGDQCVLCSTQKNRHKGISVRCIYLCVCVRVFVEKNTKIGGGREFCSIIIV